MKLKEYMPMFEGMGVMMHGASSLSEHNIRLTSSMRGTILLSFIPTGSGVSDASIILREDSISKILQTIDFIQASKPTKHMEPNIPVYASHISKTPTWHMAFVYEELIKKWSLIFKISETKQYLFIGNMDEMLIFHAILNEFIETDKLKDMII